MIHLYAEHLLNIRTLSIQAQLSTVSSKETKAKLSADGSILTLNHEGESASIKLPINLSPNRQSNVILTIPAVPSRELTFRIQLEEKEGVTNGVLSNGATVESGNVVPWTASSLTGETEIRCKSCDIVFSTAGGVREWKDLPSEGWAEMMDFWHCHKPNEPHQPDNGPLGKGYAADRQVALEQGVGMVDATSFLLDSGDCTNISILDSATSNTANTLLRCAKCQALIGRTDPTTGGYKLYKLHLSLSIRSGDPPTSFGPQKWLACCLLDAMETQGARKFIASEPHPTSEEVLKLWIFSPDLSVSSSATSSTEYVKVTKVLWQDSSPPTDIAERLNNASLSEGELTLGPGQVKLLRRTLEQSSKMLPENAREFQDWNVGLLEHFTPEDLESA